MTRTRDILAAALVGIAALGGQAQAGPAANPAECARLAAEVKKAQDDLNRAKDLVSAREQAHRAECVGKPEALRRSPRCLKLADDLRAAQDGFKKAGDIANQAVRKHQTSCSK